MIHLLLLVTLWRPKASKRAVNILSCTCVNDYLIIELSNKVVFSLAMMEILGPSEAECSKAQKEGRKGDIDWISFIYFRLFGRSFLAAQCLKFLKMSHFNFATFTFDGKNVGFSKSSIQGYPDSHFWWRTTNMWWHLWILGNFFANFLFVEGEMQNLFNNSNSISKHTPYISRIFTNRNFHFEMCEKKS